MMGPSAPPQQQQHLPPLHSTSRKPTPPRSLPQPLPLARQTSASGPLPALDPSNPDPRSAGSMSSSEGGPPTPSDFPRLVKELAGDGYPGANKRRASTTALHQAPRVLLQPIPPFGQRKSLPPRQESVPTTPNGPPNYPSVFERPSPSPNADANGMDIDDDTSLEEGEVGRRGLGISVVSSSGGPGPVSRKRRADEGSDYEPGSNSPKQVKREPSSSPHPVSAGSSHSSLSLDTLASAASALSHTGAQLHPTLPHPPPSPIVLPLQPQSDPQKASQLANALSLRTQQLREIERRRASNGPSAASAASGMGGLSGALDKLSARTTTSTGGSTSPGAVDGTEGSGLAKRRGNLAREKTKNLTVLTSSTYGPAASGGIEAGLKSAPAKAPASRMAPGVTPSVLAGPSTRGGMATARPDFAGERRDSEGSRGRTVVLPAAGTKSERPRPPATNGSLQPAPSQSASRREPYPSVTQPVQTAQRDRAEGSSYHPREREQPRPAAHSLQQPPHSSAHAHFPNSAHAYASNAQQLQQLQAPPRSARPYQSPPSRHSPPSAHSHSHSHSQQSGPHGQPSPLPPMSSQPHQQMQQVHNQPAPYAASPSSTASKAAFLSLFSTFYDSLSDSRVLAHTLEEQIRRSSSLLHTLHESGKVFEDMLDKRVKEVVEDMSRDLVLNEGRIVRLEKLIGVGAGAKGDERDSGMSDRLGRLESMVERLLDQRGSERKRTEEMEQ